MAEKIPQNIDKEDKLVGPLTLKQFLYILGAAAVIFVAYQGYIIGYLFDYEFFIVSIIAALIAVAFAFLKINGRPFIVFVLNLIEFWFSNKKITWQKDEKIDLPKEETLVTDARNTIETKTPQDTNEDSPKKSELEKLAHVLDSGGKIKTGNDLGESHSIHTIPQSSTASSDIIEDQLGVEDIFEETDI
ncbi:MAG: PrgI family protein [Patescibacteria group bacterium]|nr:PrgI family protein [Patescibacteria group bacterium]